MAWSAARNRWLAAYSCGLDSSSTRSAAAGVPAIIGVASACRRAAFFRSATVTGAEPPDVAAVPVPDVPDEPDPDPPEPDPELPEPPEPGSPPVGSEVAPGSDADGSGTEAVGTGSGGTDTVGRGLTVGSGMPRSAWAPPAVPATTAAAAVATAAVARAVRAGRMLVLLATGLP